jgi:hypothetical protein
LKRLRALLRVAAQHKWHVLTMRKETTTKPAASLLMVDNRMEINA